MITIENNKYRASINRIGAEVQSFQNKYVDDYEYIWNDPTGKIWHRHFPILFPAIGRSNHNEYKLNNQTYPMMQHGFARDYSWTDINRSPDQVTFVLHENEQTLKIYPFKFTLAVTYQLTDQGLKISSKVTNNDEKPLPFALGFHPAFNAFQQPNGNFDNYEMTVEPVKGKLQKFGTGPIPFRNGKIEDLKGSQDNHFPLTHELLDDGLVLLANTEIQKATMKSANHPRYITVDCGNFPYLNLWSPEHQKAPFICIEPFAGLPDQASDQATDWYHKEGNTILKPQETKEFYFQIEFN